jgi:hypothetical protein
MPSLGEDITCFNFEGQMSSFLEAEAHVKFSLRGRITAAAPVVLEQNRTAFRVQCMRQVWPQIVSNVIGNLSGLLCK